MRIVGYVRVSTKEQAEHGQGLNVQRAEIKRWAKAHGHKLVNIYTDAGVSGSNGIEDREELPLVLEAIRTGQAQGVVIDRLARTLTIQEGSLAALWKVGATVYSVDQGEIPADDPDDPLRTMIRQVLGAIAEFDKASLLKRMAAGRQHKADQGGYAFGSPPFGWRADASTHQLVGDPAEQETLRRIRALRDQDVSLRGIAAKLAEEGRPTRRGGPWQPTTLRNLLAR